GLTVTEITVNMSAPAARLTGRGRNLPVRFIVAMLLLLPGAVAAGKRPARLRLSVTPSDAIETRVREEIHKGETILDGLSPENMLDSPYLVSAVYYHEGFLDDYPVDRADANPSRRIIGRLSLALTPELKTRYIRLLREIHVFPAGAPQFVLPVPYNAARNRRRRRNHKYAIDLFAHEGTPVRSATRGVVALAEGNWSRDDPFSTSSQEGGNTVIVFDPATNRFYRYCHLGSVRVSAGEPVEAGQDIGAVGHSGANASQRGHGGHLHFEVNEYNGRVVRPFTYKQLSALITSARRRTAHSRAP
ncbi:MAG: M23 family metallopeptidase, partial [Acidobacteria bacterium]|nr:M23 family metallopeptidase [Acidobacteriota bacterium]